MLLKRLNSDITKKKVNQTFLRQLANTVGIWCLQIFEFSGYSSLPRSCLSAGLDGAGMSEGSTGVSFSSPYCPDNTLPLLEPVSEDQEIHGRRNNGQSHLIFLSMKSFVLPFLWILLNWSFMLIRDAWLIQDIDIKYRFV